MIRFLSVLCLLLCLCSVASAERVTDLPQDSGKLYLSVFGDEGDARFVQLRQWFDVNLELRTLRDRTHFNILPASSGMYRERFAKFVRKLPCVLLTDAAGNKLCEMAGDEVPTSADVLIKTLIGKVHVRTFGLEGCPLKRKAVPQEQPAKPQEPQQPLTVEPVTSEFEKLYPGLVTILGVVSVLAGYMIQARK